MLVHIFSSSIAMNLCWQLLWQVLFDKRPADHVSVPPHAHVNKSEGTGTLPFWFVVTFICRHLFWFHSWLIFISIMHFEQVFFFLCSLLMILWLLNALELIWYFSLCFLFFCILFMIPCFFTENVRTFPQPRSYKPAHATGDEYLSR